MLYYTNGQPSDVAIDGTTVYVTDLKTGGIVFANGATKPTGTLKSKYIKSTTSASRSTPITTS